MRGLVIIICGNSLYFVQLYICLQLYFRTTWKILRVRVFYRAPLYWCSLFSALKHHGLTFYRLGCSDLGHIKLTICVSFEAIFSWLRDVTATTYRAIACVCVCVYRLAAVDTVLFSIQLIPPPFGGLRCLCELVIARITSLSDIR